MFQTNTAREIFYIFSWLVGIIVVYALVDTFILEPKADKESHSMQIVQNNAHKDVSAIEKKSVSTKSVATKQVTKVSKPVSVTKVPQVVTVTQPAKVQKTHPTSTQKSIDKPVVKKTDATKSVSPQDTSLEKAQSISSPTIPQMPKTVTTHESTIKIPTIPSVPAVPTASPSKKNTTETPTIITPEKTEKKDITKATDALEKELSQEDRIQLIEKSRQMVIEEAEKARNEALEAIERSFI